MLVFICNLNRGVLTPVQGVPWVIPFLVVILIAQSFMLARTRLGRYIYAIGASPEAARRAGIHVARVRTIAFALCSFTSGLAVVVYASRLGSLSVGFDGGTYVLYAVAAAVIGGASLFGGHGKPIHPVLGGLVIATLTNGLALLNISTAGTDIATAAVLLVAVAVDSTLRRRGADTRRGLTPRRPRPACPARANGAPRRPRRHRSCLLALVWAGPAFGSTASTTSPAPSPSWTVYHGDPAGSGVASGRQLGRRRLARLDLPDLDGELYGEPLVSEGQVFVATENDTVYALSATNGAVDVVDRTLRRLCRRRRSPAVTSLPRSGSPARRCSTRRAARSSWWPTR